MFAMKGLFLKENAVDCIEDRKDDNRNCEIDESAGSEFHAFDVQGEDDFFEERENDAVDHEDERAERHDHERESENLQERPDEGVEHSQDYAAYEIKFPTALRDDFRHEVRNAEEN